MTAIDQVTAQAAYILNIYNNLEQFASVCSFCYKNIVAVQLSACNFTTAWHPGKTERHQKLVQDLFLVA